MLQQALKIVLIVVALGWVAQDANAFGHHGWRWGHGRGGYGWGGGCGFGGYGYGGYGYGGYLAGSSGGYALRPLVNSSPQRSDLARFTVNVPADAKVFINDQPTRSTGERRYYSSSGLRPAAVYAFRVRAEFIRDGKPISEEKTVQLTAGQTGSLAFSVSPDAQVADTTAPAVR